MKCVKLNQTFQRVTESEAEKLVRTGWSYCSKTEWKKSLIPVKDFTPVETAENKEKTVQKILKKTKRMKKS